MYFPAVTGTIISTDAADFEEDGKYILSREEKDDNGSGKTDKTKKFIPQVTYECFKELMREMEEIIGEEGSHYSHEMMITYFGLSDMNYK